MTIKEIADAVKDHQKMTCDAYVKFKEADIKFLDFIGQLSDMVFPMYKKISEDAGDTEEMWKAHEKYISFSRTYIGDPKYYNLFRGLLAYYIRPRDQMKNWEIFYYGTCYAGEDITLMANEFGDDCQITFYELWGLMTSDFSYNQFDFSEGNINKLLKEYHEEITRRLASGRTKYFKGLEEIV